MPACSMDGHKPRRLAVGWLALAALILAAVVLAACSGSSSQGSEDGVKVQPLATATATHRPAPSATRTTPSPTPEPPTPTTAAATATAEPTAEPTAEATPTSSPPPPTAEAIPTPAPVPAQPTDTPVPPPPAPPASTGVTLAPSQVVQGGATVVQVVGASAAAASADFAGSQYPLLASGGVFWGVLGVPANQPPGEYPVLVTLTTADGRALRQMEASLTVTAAGYPVEDVQLDPAVAALLDPTLIVEELNHRAAIYSVFTPERLWSGPFLMPVQGPISGAYGAGRSYNGGPVTDYHHGTDIAAEEGTPVIAANTGRVAFAGDLTVRGRSVILDHGAGVFSAYHHLSEIDVVEGQLVNKGDVIGAVGQTGLAEGPHLALGDRGARGGGGRAPLDAGRVRALLPPGSKPGLRSNKPASGAQLAQLVEDGGGGNDARRLRAQDTPAQRYHLRPGLAGQGHLVGGEASLRPDEDGDRRALHRLEGGPRPPEGGGEAQGLLVLPGQKAQVGAPPTRASSRLSAGRTSGRTQRPHCSAASRTTRRQRSDRPARSGAARTTLRRDNSGTKAATPSSVPFSSTQSKRSPLMSDW